MTPRIHHRTLYKRQSPQSDQFVDETHSPPYFDAMDKEIDEGGQLALPSREPVTPVDGSGSRQIDALSPDAKYLQLHASVSLTRLGKNNDVSPNRARQSSSSNTPLKLTKEKLEEDLARMKKQLQQLVKHSENKDPTL